MIVRKVCDHAQSFFGFETPRKNYATETQLLRFIVFLLGQGHERGQNHLF